MIKFYIGTIITCMVFTFILCIRVKSLKLKGDKKSTKSEKLYSYLKYITLVSLPIFNIFYAVVFIALAIFIDDMELKRLWNKVLGDESLE